MNNFQVKNVLSNSLINNDLPLKDIDDISLKPTQTLNVTINNTFTRLVDNDLYNRKFLYSFQNYHAGPKEYTDISNIQNQPVGYKVWCDELSTVPELSILRKNYQDISKSIFPTNITDKVNFIINTSEPLIGTPHGLYRKTNLVYDTWTNNYSDVLSNKNCTLYYQDADTNIILLTTKETNNNNKIYLLSGDIIENSQLSVKELYSVDKTQNINNIYFDNSSLYVSYSDNKVYRAAFDKYKIPEQLVFNELTLSNKNLLQNVNAITTQNNKPYIATQDGLYSTFNQNNFIDTKNILTKKGDAKFFLTLNNDNTLYFVTSKGIYTNTGKEQIALENIQTYGYFNGDFYVGTSSGLYKITTDKSTWGKIDILTDISVTSIKQYGNWLVIGTEYGKIKYVSTITGICANWKDVDISTNKIKFLRVQGSDLQAVYNNDNNLSIRNVYNTTSSDVDIGKDSFYSDIESGVKYIFNANGLEFIFTEDNKLYKDRKQVLNSYTMYDLDYSGEYIAFVANSTTFNGNKAVYIAKISDLTTNKVFELTETNLTNIKICFNNLDIFVVGNTNSIQYIQLDNDYKRTADYLIDCGDKTISNITTSSNEYYYIGKDNDTSENSFYKISLNASFQLEDSEFSQISGYELSDLTIYNDQKTSDIEFIGAKEGIFGFKFDENLSAMIRKNIKAEGNKEIDYTDAYLANVRYYKETADESNPECWTSVIIEPKHIIVGEDEILVTLHKNVEETVLSSVLSVFNTNTNDFNSYIVCGNGKISAYVINGVPGFDVRDKEGEGEGKEQTEEPFEIQNTLTANSNNVLNTFRFDLSSRLSSDIIFFEPNNIRYTSFISSNAYLFDCKQVDVPTELTNAISSLSTAIRIVDHKHGELSSLSTELSDIFSDNKELSVVKILKDESKSSLFFLSQNDTTQKLYGLSIANDIDTYTGNLDNSNLVDIFQKNNITSFDDKTIFDFDVFSNAKIGTTEESEYTILVSSVKEDIKYLNIIRGNDLSSLTDKVPNGYKNEIESNNLKVWNLFGQERIQKDGLSNINAITFSSQFNEGNIVSSNVNNFFPCNNNLLLLNDNGISVLNGDSSDYIAGSYDKVVFDNGNYYLMGIEKGLSSVKEIKSSEQKTTYPLLADKKVYNVFNQRYSLSDGIYKDIETKVDILTAGTLYGKEGNYNISSAWEKNGNILFRYGNHIGEIKNFDKDNNTFTVTNISGVYGDKTYILKVDGDNIIVDENDKVIDKSSGKEVIYDYASNIDGNKKTYLIEGTKFKSFDKIDEKEYLNIFDNKIKPTKFYNTSNDKIGLINNGNRHGLYEYDVNSKSFVQKLRTEKAIRDIRIDNINNLVNYFYDQNLYEISTKFNRSSNKWILSIDNDINDALKINDRKYLIANENGGLSCTKYISWYELDTPAQSIDILSNMISDEISVQLEKHISDYHKIDSKVSKLNNKVHRSLSNIVDVDAITEYEYDGFVDYIKAKSSHSETYSKYDQDYISDIRYIYRKYPNINQTDKIGELYINIPTTNTYYLAHVKGIPNYNFVYESIEQLNTNLSTSINLNDNTTLLSVFIDKDHFGINTIYSCEINGSSLPLKVYNDTRDQFYDGYKFNQAIKSSTLIRNNVDQFMYDDKFMVFVFKIYGTDEQSIHLTYNCK